MDTYACKRSIRSLVNLGAASRILNFRGRVLLVPAISHTVSGEVYVYRRNSSWRLGVNINPTPASQPRRGWRTAHEGKCYAFIIIRAYLYGPQASPTENWLDDSWLLSCSRRTMAGRNA
jgi:hypothetical protein